MCTYMNINNTDLKKYFFTKKIINMSYHNIAKISAAYYYFYIINLSTWLRILAPPSVK